MLLADLQVDLDNATVYGGSKVFDLMLLCQVLADILPEGVKRAFATHHLIPHSLY